jgi:S1-C subfamily serine protease
MGYLPEVVRIIAAQTGGPTGGKAIGTGFFLAVDGNLVQEEGLLLTNAHVVTNSPVVKIMTTFIEHQALPVTVVAVCHDRDLALLKVEPQVHQWLKRVLKSRFNLDHIPALSFGDSDQLRVGHQVHAVGHPLGLIDQQFTTGDYQGPVHLNNEIRGLSGALINGGNSGGPLIRTMSLPSAGTPAGKEQSFEGLHYFQPSRYELVGVNTFKLTGANVDGENGFIHANTVKTVLPTLMAPLAVRYEREKSVQAMMSKLQAGGLAARPSTITALHDHLTEDEINLMQDGSLDCNWSEYNMGGLVRGQPRTFQSWLMRHVVAPNNHHLHRGGPQLLSKVLDYVNQDDWEGLSEWKGNRRWAEVREELTSTKTPETMPSVIRILPPPAAHIHSPQIGITSQPIFTNDILVHYECPQNNKGGWMASGGVLVSAIQPHSMYLQAGGMEGDIIHRFKNTSTSASLSAGGTWYSAKRDLPMSLTDLCNDTPINEEITLGVLRPGGKLFELTLTNREPTYQELPPIRQTYGYCDEGRFESKQKLQVQGIQFSPLRLQHVSMFKLLEFMSPEKRYGFHVVVEAVSPESPAYATDAIHAGAIVTHINDEPVAHTWEEVQAQMSQPHAKTGCWVLNTDYNGSKSKFVMATRQNIFAKSE